jgi:hypothetical protein
VSTIQQELPGPAFARSRVPALTKAFSYPAGCLDASTTACRNERESSEEHLPRVVSIRIGAPLTKALSYPHPTRS